MVQSMPDLNKVAQSIPLKREVLVLGGGVSGITIADILARSGIHVTLVEKRKNLGGLSKQFCLFSNRPGDSDNRISGKMARLSESPHITLITGAELVGMEGHFGSFQAKIRKESGETILLFPSAVVVATGYITRRDAKGIPDSGCLAFLSDMERLIAETGESGLLWNGKPLNTVTFVLDQANDDIKLDASTVLEQSLVLRQKYNCQVYVLCKDLKVSFTSGERLYRKAREAGVLFFKYEETPEYSLVGDRICVALPDNTNLKKEEQEKITLLSDLLVLPEVCLPDPEAEQLCRTLRLRMGKGGRFMDDNPQFLRIRSNRRGVFVAGACRFPQLPAETLKEAEAAAQEITALLAPGVYECGPLVAEVNADKCALCYTCPRLCPHSAIGIERYAGKNVYYVLGNGDRWNAARVEPAACYGCGICVAECPARAISLRGEDALSLDAYAK